MGIFVDQTGYKNVLKKFAVVTAAGEYKVVNATTGECVLTKEAALFGKDPLSEDEVYRVDFSDIEADGTYRVVGNNEESDSFTIGNNIYSGLLKDLSKALYFQRCGCALEEKHAGIYKHGACHTDRVVLLEDYVNKTANPQTFDLRGGWHDAGDFGRYTTAGAVAVGHILYAYELFNEVFDYDMNIPESGNGVPDILNECRYELDWLIKMQAQDGGVYHKLTAFTHAPFIMPEEDKDQFMLYPVSSVAVADYVAIMALAARVYAKFDADFSDRALKAARKSFEWLQNNGNIEFHNYEGSHTGEYGDKDDRDERLWAAAEMLRTDKTGDVAAYKAMFAEYINSDVSKTDFGWTDVSGFALLSVLTDKNSSVEEEICEILKKAMYAKADELLNDMKDNAYELAMKAENFVWGSNMVVLNRAMLLALAAMLSDENDSKADIYEAAVSEQLHYILGRNAINRSYVTGYGEHAYKNPHNRPTAMDGIDDPMPGWVSGGPYTYFCDADALKILPKGLAPMKCHADVVGSYSTNEITIYWNSPAIFVVAYLISRT